MLEIFALNVIIKLKIWLIRKVTIVIVVFTKDTISKDKTDHFMFPALI